MIYLSGPIDNCNFDETYHWRFRAENLLGSGSVHIPPAAQFEGKADAEVVEYDKSLINKSDVLLANVWKYSAGTSMEIFYAHEQHKLVVTVCKPEIRSAWLRHHSDYMFSTVDEACHFLNTEGDKAILNKLESISLLPASGGMFEKGD